jgi:hypothetical protein
MVIIEVSTNGVSNIYVRSTTSLEEKANEVILQIIRRHLVGINEDIKGYRERVRMEDESRGDGE